MTADLAQFYNVNLDDVWAGRVSAGWVLKLASQLVLNPNARVRMIELDGSPLDLGWDASTERIADVFDLFSISIAARGGKGAADDAPVMPRVGRRGKPRELGEVPSSPVADEGELFAPSIADFNVGAWMQLVSK